MKFFTKTCYAKILAGFSVLLFSSALMAGGPLEVCNSGEPYVWPDGGVGVPFNPDQGALGILDATAATQAVSDAFQAWEDVPSATISYNNEGNLPIDVDDTNFAPFLEATEPDGLSAIVFDDDGAIFDLLFGAGSGILGFASPEFLDDTNCTVLEGFSFLNGPAIASLEGLLDLMVHEFGHYSNLAHTEVNGQIYADGDSSGPGLDNTTFGFAPDPFDPAFDELETMYPFLFGGIDQKARTPHADDTAILSTLYPEADFAATTGSISGTVFFGDNKVTGINVIARNLSDPFADAVSAISSDFTRDYSQGDAVAGTYTLNGLTAGADYAVFVNGLLSGNRFSTPVGLLPGPEEFFNGASESSDGNIDDPSQLTSITASAGVVSTNTDIYFNLPLPGEPLNTGDDGNVEIPLPFNFCVAGETYGSVYINGNGFVTLGSPDVDFLNFLESEASFLGGPPRIAALWRDLSPNVGGSVTYEQSGDTFTVTWDAVPEFGGIGSNTFSIKLRDNSRLCEPDSKGRFFNGFITDVEFSYGEISATNGLVGVSSGIEFTSQFETSEDLSEERDTGIFDKVTLYIDAARHELFNIDNPFDLGNSDLGFRGLGTGYNDDYEYERRNRRNNTLENASRINLPFDSKDTFRDYTSLSPDGEDVDFYQFGEPLIAGTTLVAEILTGQIDSVMGLYLCNNISVNSGKGKGRRNKRCKTSQAELVAVNDDTNGLLSSIVYEVPEDGYYVLAVSYFNDLDFDGVDLGQGEPFDGGRYVLDISIVNGVLVELGDDATAEVTLGIEFPYQGTTYNSVFINSNGSLTFGEGSTDFSESIVEMEAAPPRIAPLWTDLSPNVGGMIVVGTPANGSQTISFMDVPEFFVGGSNSFTVILSNTGQVAIEYSGVSAPEAIVGVSAGDGSTGSSVDLSSQANWSAIGTTYEEFLLGASEVDLAGTTIRFDP